MFWSERFDGKRKINQQSGFDRSGLTVSLEKN